MSERCGTCGRVLGNTTGTGMCLDQNESDCWRARAERLEAERDEAVAEAKELRRQVTIQAANNHERNVELDALHYVWCEGGCEGGAHRYTHAPLTQEHVDAAIRNTTRLVQYWRNKQYRAEYDGGGLEKRAHYNTVVEQLNAAIAERDAAVGLRDEAIGWLRHALVTEDPDDAREWLARIDAAKEPG